MFGIIGTMGILLGSSISDIRWKKIPSVILTAGGVWAFIGIILNIVKQGFFKTCLISLLGILPGVGLLVISRVTEKKVGFGDGILLVLIGLLEGIGKALLVFCVGLFLQSVFAVVLVIAGKAGKQTCIPFVPFLLAARVILFLV